MKEEPPSGMGDKSNRALEDMTAIEYARMDAMRWYGDFELTKAIRPHPRSNVIPREGYRHDVYRRILQPDLPVLMIAASKAKLYDLFLDLTEPLGNEIDVVLETSHECAPHTDIYIEKVDAVVLQSHLWEYQDLLLNDGCTGICVLNPEHDEYGGVEVQFDEHKLIAVYCAFRRPFEEILRRYGLLHDQSMQFVTNEPHVHYTNDFYEERLRSLYELLGGDRDDDPFSCS